MDAMAGDQIENKRSIPRINKEKLLLNLGGITVDRNR
jgi:hypothetical protein